MVKLTINLRNIDGVKLFSRLMDKVGCEVDICSGRYVIDAKSIMGLYTLSLNKDVTLVIHNRTPEEVDKIHQMMKDNGFLVKED